MNNIEFQEEKENLKKIIEKYKETIEYYNLRIDAIPRIYENNPYMLKNSIEMYSEKLRLMEKSKDKPYFARIDFARDGEKNIEKLYIGKVGVMDEDNNNITIDWRAPISSMYYDSNIGKSSYVAPEGICTGELLLKRQYDIENAELKSFQDVDTVSNDELLKPYLNMSADSRLKNIVSTIQQEQNAIIREPISKNIIIQGVAGSGKTTVALHRIAYLVYNYRESVKPNQYLVIGPNQFFVNYISAKLINEEEKLILSIENEEMLEYEKFKVSMGFKKVLDNFIQEFERNIIPNKGIEMKGYEIISSEIIKNIYFSIENLSFYDNINKKIERTKLVLFKYIEDNHDEIMEHIRTQYQKNKNGDNVTNRMELDKLNSIEREVNNSCKYSINKYFKNLIPNIINLYIKFLMEMENYIEPEFYKSVKLKIQKNVENIKKGKTEFEDLSALIYLKCKVLGIENYEQYKQVAIDEAQDYGDFSFYALKYLLKNATFSIFGDLAQSIYQYRGIKNWESVRNNTFNNNCEIKYLLKSYRTTTEIMDSANNISSYIKLDTAKPVIRHGDNVNYINYDNVDKQIDIIKSILNQYKEKKYKTVAIICKNNEETTQIRNRLQKDKIVVNNITDSDTQYYGGICTITSYLAKGLEFDGVIVANASEKEYRSDKDIDMKLLYVSMTRPLHELNILYRNNLVKPLQNSKNL